MGPTFSGALTACKRTAMKRRQYRGDVINIIRTADARWRLDNSKIKRAYTYCCRQVSMAARWFGHILWVGFGYVKG